MSTEGLQGESQQAAPAAESSEQGFADQAAPAEQMSQRAEKVPDQRMELMARKEREWLQRESRYREELKSKQELERKILEYESKEKMFDTDPWAVMQQKGWSIDKLAEHIGSTHEPIQGEEKRKLYGKLDEMQSYIKKLESSLQERDEKQTEAQRGQVKNRLINDLKELAEKDSDRFELVKHENAYEYVFQVLNDYYEENKAPLDPAEAMEHVEKLLEKQYAKGLQYKKIKSKFGGSFENSDSQEMNQIQEPINYTPKTLTNNFSQTTPPQSQRPLTREESIKRAASLIRFDD